MKEIHNMSPKINEILIDFWRSEIYLTFLSHWFLEILCPDYKNVPLIFGDIKYIYVSKNQWDILLVMDFIDFIDFQRYSLLGQKSVNFAILIFEVM